MIITIVVEGWRYPPTGNAPVNFHYNIQIYTHTAHLRTWGWMISETSQLLLQLGRSPTLHEKPHMSPGINQFTNDFASNSNPTPLPLLFIFRMAYGNPITLKSNTRSNKGTQKEYLKYQSIVFKRGFNICGKALIHFRSWKLIEVPFHHVTTAWSTKGTHGQNMCQNISVTQGWYIPGSLPCWLNLNHSYGKLR